MMSSNNKNYEIDFMQIITVPTEHPVLLVIQWLCLSLLLGGKKKLYVENFQLDFIYSDNVSQLNRNIFSVLN